MDDGRENTLINMAGILEGSDGWGKAEEFARIAGYP